MLLALLSIFAISLVPPALAKGKLVFGRTDGRGPYEPSQEHISYCSIELLDCVANPGGSSAPQVEETNEEFEEDEPEINEDHVVHIVATTLAFCSEQKSMFTIFAGYDDGVTLHNLITCINQNIEQLSLFDTTVDEYTEEVILKVLSIQNVRCKAEEEELARQKDPINSSYFDPYTNCIAGNL